MRSEICLSNMSIDVNQGASISGRDTLDSDESFDIDCYISLLISECGKMRTSRGGHGLFSLVLYFLGCRIAAPKEEPSE
jgi:hypothetical protein